MTVLISTTLGVTEQVLALLRLAASQYCPHFLCPENLESPLYSTILLTFQKCPFLPTHLPTFFLKLATTFRTGLGKVEVASQAFFPGLPPLPFFVRLPSFSYCLPLSRQGRNLTLSNILPVKSKKNKAVDLITTSKYYYKVPCFPLHGSRRSLPSTHPPTPS